MWFGSREALSLAMPEEGQWGGAEGGKGALAAWPEGGRRSPRRILHAVAAAVAAHVMEETETCRVLMEARALAAHEPAIAAAVRAADNRTHEQDGSLIAARWAAG